jgi:hypothetical protein
LFPRHVARGRKSTIAVKGSSNLNYITASEGADADEGDAKELPDAPDTQHSVQLSSSPLSTVPSEAVAKDIKMDDINTVDTRKIRESQIEH